MRRDRIETARASVNLDLRQKGKKKSGSALGKSKALVEKQTLTVYDSAESIAELRGFAKRLQNKRTASHSRRLDRVDC